MIEVHVASNPTTTGVAQAANAFANPEPVLLRAEKGFRCASRLCLRAAASLASAWTDLFPAKKEYLDTDAAIRRLQESARFYDRQRADQLNRESDWH